MGLFHCDALVQIVRSYSCGRRIAFQGSSFLLGFPYKNNSRLTGLPSIWVLGRLLPVMVTRLVSSLDVGREMRYTTEL